MLRKLSLIVVYVLLSLVSATAEDETSIQMGTLPCNLQPPGGGMVGKFTCGTFTFNNEFGGQPQVSVSLSQYSMGNSTITVTAEGITATQFTPYITVERAPIEPVNNGTGGFTTQSTKTSGTKTKTKAAAADANYVPDRYMISWVAVGPSFLTEPIRPKYVVLTVLYSPPGSNGGANRSNVSYAEGSTTGTTVSASNSFSKSSSVSTEAQVGAAGNELTSSVSFAYSHSTANNWSVDFKKTTTSKIDYLGPNLLDGINHDFDIIYVWINPTIDLSLSATSAKWRFDSETAAQADIEELFVIWLKHPDQMQAGLKNKLDQLHFTQKDYNEILSHDPFATDSSYTPDHDRYVLRKNFPYTKSPAPNQPVPIKTFAVDSSTTTSAGSEAKDSSKVELSTSKQGKWFDFAKVTLKDTTSWEWANTVSQSTSTSQTESASVAVGGPSYDYKGYITDIQVYYDTLYKTFAFVPISYPPSIKGTVTTATGGRAPAWTEVTLNDNDVRQSTFTDVNGEYRFFGSVSRSAQVGFNGSTQQVSGEAPFQVNIKIPK